MMIGLGRGGLEGAPFNRFEAGNMEYWIDSEITGELETHCLS